MAEKISDFDYPRWKYHEEHSPVIVNSAKEEAALGYGWENSPAYFENVSEDSENKKTRKKKKTNVDS